MGKTSSTALLGCLLLCAAIASADSPPPFFSYYRYDLQFSSPQGALPQDSVVQVRYTNQYGANFTTAVAVRDSGNATLYTSAAGASAQFLYDDPATPSADGEWEGSLESAGQPVLVRLQPIGDIAGVVQNDDGSPAAGAAVEITCPGGEERSAAASPTGAFSFARMPAGKCIASASSNGESAQESFDLSQGEFHSLFLQLRKPYSLVFAAGVFLLAAAAVLAAWRLAQKPKGPPGKKAGGRRRPPALSAPAQAMPTQRQKDLLATLDEKERGVVEYVMHHYPGSVKVPKLRRDLLIPKTSLTRTLQALERKQFLKAEKVGSRMFVKLHDFFRGS